jgi:hypothetical protein
MDDDISYSPPDTSGMPVRPRRTCFRAGLLEKEGQKRKSWRRRFFRLFEDGLFYYRDASSAQDDPLGFTLFDSSTVIGNAPERTDVQNCFKVLSTNRAPLYVCAPSPMDLQAWLDAVRTVLRTHHFERRDAIGRLFQDMDSSSTSSTTFLTREEEWAQYVDGQLFTDEYLLVRCPASMVDNSEYSFTMLVHGTIYLTTHRLIFYACVLNKEHKHVGLGEKIAGCEPYQEDGLTISQADGSKVQFRNLESRQILAQRVLDMAASCVSRKLNASTSSSAAPSPRAQLSGSPCTPKAPSLIMRRVSHDTGTYSDDDTPLDVDGGSDGAEYSQLVQKYAKLRARPATSLSSPKKATPTSNSSTSLLSPTASSSLSAQQDDDIMLCKCSRVSLQYVDKDRASAQSHDGVFFVGCRFLLFMGAQVTQVNLRRFMSMDPKFASFFCRPLAWSRMELAGKTKLRVTLLSDFVSEMGPSYEIAFSSSAEVNRVLFVYKHRGRPRVIMGIRSIQRQVRKWIALRHPQSPSASSSYGSLSSLGSSTNSSQSALTPQSPTRVGKLKKTPSGSTATSSPKPPHLLVLREFPIKLKAQALHDACIEFVKDVRTSKVHVMVEVECTIVRSYPSTEVIDVSSGLADESAPNLNGSPMVQGQSPFTITFKDGSFVCGFSKYAKDIMLAAAEFMWV